MYKKVYVEITNNCNLKCDFCIKNSRENKFMSLVENLALDYPSWNLKGHSEREKI